ncbi:amino acid ABC transporter permease [Ensifer adhaerens]|nr:amino acid ABC transporter permease [Ensifer adhaerens]UAY05070.1 amino acid ABC transporter permease [Ensifer adhaerens]UAY12490.1 amino acid ABC transporter permease [Ensifer adhaerens]
MCQLAVAQASDPGLIRFCYALNLLCVICAGGVLWFSFVATKASHEADARVRTGLILEARALSDRSRQESLVCFGLSATLLIACTAVMLVVMNDGAVQKTFLRPDVMLASLQDVSLAFLVNIAMAIVAQILVMIFGLALAVARMMPGRAGAPIRFLAVAYIDLFRAVPAVIVIYLVGFGLPLANIPVVSEFPPILFAIVALTATYSAYIAETFRSGIESIHPSQWSASRSLGIGYVRTLRYIILPQAIRNVIPPLLSSFIGLQKDTALVNIIGTMDAFNQAKFYASTSFNLSSVTVVAILFFVFTIPQTRLVDRLLATRARRG